MTTSPDLPDVTGRRVRVAGGSSGIGIARVFPARGATVHVWGARPEVRADIPAVNSCAGNARDLAQLPRHVVLAGDKLAILLEGSYARACTGRAPLSIGERHHASAQRLVVQALARIDAGTATRPKETFPC